MIPRTILTALLLTLAGVLGVATALWITSANFPLR
jgi:hypothetical protein